MPSESPAQHHLMEAVAHNPGFAKKVGIPQSVGKDFSMADKGRKFGSGGSAKPFAGKETYAEELAEAREVKSGKISPQKFARNEVKEERGMKKMASGGTAVAKGGAGMGSTVKKGPNFGPSRGMTNPMPQPKAMGTLGRAFASGGKIEHFSSAGKNDYSGPYKKDADGVASRGKTDATQVVMKRGGKVKGKK